VTSRLGRRRARHAAGAALAAALAVACPRGAGALVEPARAQADVEAAMRDADYAFCKKPREPLSAEAHALCPHASAIAGCEGFAAACAREDAPARKLDLPEWLLGAIAWIVRWGGYFVAWVLLPALVLALLFPVVRALARLRRDRRLADPDAHPPAEAVAEPPGEVESATDEETLLGRAEERTRRGEYAAALELYLAASLLALDKRGALRLSKAGTNGEYVRACAEADSRAGLRSLVREVDRVKFGREAATGDAVERAGAAARGIVRVLAAATAALALVCCCGCGDGRRLPGPPRAGDDPAGGELLLDLLRRQGFHAGHLDGSLSSLPLPAPGERAPAVIVDAERTELDEETRSHLVEWVGAGGSLVLAGMPRSWPKELGLGPAFSAGSHRISARRLLSRGSGGDAPDPAAEGTGDQDDDDDDDSQPAAVSSGPIYATGTEHGEVAASDALQASKEGERVAWFDGDLKFGGSAGDAGAYAVAVPHGKGWVVGIATDELLTNAALARPGNAATLLAILSNADREELRLAQPEDGVSPPSTPLAALERAGLGLGLVHALLAALVLFLAEGVRLARPVPDPPPHRRAFAEHVEAVGALYHRTGSAAHALAAYARFADHRLRARMPRGAADVGAFLSSRTRLPLDLCQRVWARAVSADAAAPAGDELEVLKELCAVYSLAIGDDW
jgi:hypothetical protein